MRGQMRPDPVLLASGAVTAALGVLVLLDSSGALTFSAGWSAAVLSAALGLLLLVSGLAKGGGDRHD
jgi:hypothetical protein